ncbi:hypothetical protein LNQ52_22625 [Klebsiella pneumoniae subsp. pneumoniae]|nr:hypothetical protein [Klebsiella pneumoniae subsp. pneumoniae]
MMRDTVYILSELASQGGDAASIARGNGGSGAGAYVPGYRLEAAGAV